MRLHSLIYQISRARCNNKEEELLTAFVTGSRTQFAEASVRTNIYFIIERSADIGIYVITSRV